MVNEMFDTDRERESEWPALDNVVTLTGDLIKRAVTIQEDSAKAIAYHEAILRDLRASKDAADALERNLSDVLINWDPRRHDVTMAKADPTRAVRINGPEGPF